MIGTSNTAVTLPALTWYGCFTPHKYWYPRRTLGSRVNSANFLWDSMNILFGAKYNTYISEGGGCGYYSNEVAMDEKLKVLRGCRWFWKLPERSLQYVIQKMLKEHFEPGNC